jgi:hypothetical protein
MGIFSKLFKPKPVKVVSGGQSFSNAPSTSSYQGPVKQGTSEKVFRDTGSSPSATTTAPTPAQTSKTSSGGSSRTTTTSQSFGGPVIYENEVSKVAKSSNQDITVIGANTTATQALAGKGTTSLAQAKKVQTLLSPTPSQTNSNIKATTLSNQPIDSYTMLNTKPPKQDSLSKPKDMFVSALATTGYDLPLSSGYGLDTAGPTQTRQSNVQSYKETVRQAKKDFWSKGGPLNPVATAKFTLAGYNARQDLRNKNYMVEDSMNKFNLNLGSPGNTQLSLIKSGVDFRDAKISRTTDIKKEILGDTEYTTTTTSQSLNIPDFKRITVAESEYERTGRYGYLVTEKAITVTGAIAGGMATSGIGLTGGFTTEGGILGRSVAYTAIKAPKVGSVLEFGARPAVQLTVIGLDTAYGGYKGYQQGKLIGANTFVTTAIGAGGNLGASYGFLAGATAGDVSPLKVWSPRMEGNKYIKGMNVVSIGEPLSGKYLTLGGRITTSGKTTVFLGGTPSTKLFSQVAPTSFKSGLVSDTPEAESFIKGITGKQFEFQSTRGIVNVGRNINIKQKGEIKLEGLKGWSKLNSAEQKVFSGQVSKMGRDISFKEFVIKGRGLRKITGGLSLQSEGAITRMTGDVDTVVGYKSNPNQMASNMVKRLNKVRSGWYAKQGQVYKGGQKFQEFLTPEDAISRPMGKFSRFTKQSKFGKDSLPSQKAGQSLTELGSAITTARYNP